MKSLRFTGAVFSTDLMPVELIRKDSPNDLLSGLRNVDDPQPNEFVETFYLSPAPVDCDRR